MRRLALALLAMAALPTAFAPAAPPARVTETQPGPVPSAPKPPPGLDTALGEVAAAAESQGGRPLRAARRSGLALSDGLVRVQVTAARASASSARGLISTRGGRVAVAYRGLIDALVPPEALHSLAGSSAIRRLERSPEAVPTAVAGQGRSVTGALPWHGGSLDGSGVKVGVIDLGFAGYTTRQAQGDLPGNLVTHNLCAGGFTGIEHGAGVAEIVHEMAPGAKLFLICADSPAALGQAEAYAGANGIRVLNHSVSYYNQGRGDGSGGPATVDGAVERARSDGILWVNAAGNSAQHHWSGSFSDTDSPADGWHNFTSTDQGNTITVPGGGQVCAALKWDSWPASTQNYDLYLKRSSDSATVSSSTDPQTGSQKPTEVLCYKNPGATANFFVAIRRQAATQAPRFDLFVFRDSSTLEYQTVAGSVTEPASAPEVMAVGAVCWQNKALEPFSSRGPTIDGRTKPDISGPDRVSSGTYGPFSSCSSGGFAGTSAAAPHVAGAAALLRDDRPELKPAGLQSALEEQVVDPGAPGKDNAYGAGWLFLARPDMQIRRAGSGAYLGNGIYTRDGTGQARSAKVKPGGKASFDLLLQNDAPGIEGYRLRAPKSSKWFKIRYLYGTLDITSSVQGAGTIPLLFSQGHTEHFTMRVKARKGSAGKRVRIVAQGLAEGGVRDAVSTAVKSKG